MLMTDLHHLSDEQLVAAIADLNRRERTATAALIAHLAELRARDLHLAMGFKSLYKYCRAILHLSEHESYNRMAAAHVARRFPVIVPMVAEGLLHLTAVRLLAPHLGDENHLALLGGAIHRSKCEVEHLVARWFPKAAVATSIRRVAAPAAADAGSGDATASFGGTGRQEASDEAASAVLPTNAVGMDADPGPGPDPGVGKGVGSGAGAGGLAPPWTPVARTAARRKATIDPLSADTYAMRLTARSATIERLRRAQEILSHAVPDGDVDEILFRALGALIEKEGKTREAAAGHGGPERQRANQRAKKADDPVARRVAAEVEREVRGRDGEQCAFVSKDGRRCEERRFLELHHEKPWIAGGERTARNISLRCAAHNRYEWKVWVAPIRAAQELMATRSGTS